MNLKFEVVTSERTDIFKEHACRSDIQYPVDEWPNTFQDEGQDCQGYKQIKEEK